MSAAVSGIGAGMAGGVVPQANNPSIGGPTAQYGNMVPGMGGGSSPVQGGTAGALAELQNALNSNSNAYQGLENTAQQQYQQNAGQVQQNLVNQGLGNTTVADTMAQAPMQTYNNALLNLTGQQQGQAANIYGQAAGVQQQGGDLMAQLASALQQPGAQADASITKQMATPKATYNGMGGQGFTI